MTKLLLENGLRLLLISPIIFFCLKNKSFETIKIVFVFVLYFILFQLSLSLPFIFPETNFNIFDGKWNWSGKIYSIVTSFLFLILYRKFPLQDYFLTLKQDKKFLKTGILIVVFGLLIQSIISFNVKSKIFNIETLLYQFSLPGIGEEIAFRGIMLGLLIKALKSKYSWFNPAIIITSILFGLIHSLFISNNYEIAFNPAYFVRSFLHGLIWSWITIKSGSILLALISHNINNGVGNIIKMR